MESKKAHAENRESAAVSRLILASGSRYRRELLARLTGDFAVVTSHVDETPLHGESAAELAARLAGAKASAVAEPGSLVIGSDQTALCRGRILGKPGSSAAQCEQLATCSGRTVVFYTAVTLLDCPVGGTAIPDNHVDITSVRFRVLNRAAIERYVAAEDATDCAGGFRIEAAGPCLFETVTTSDPTALIGLPLCWLAGALGRAGLQLPA